MAQIAEGNGIDVARKMWYDFPCLKKLYGFGRLKNGTA